jgi:hypothetical protein
LSVVIKDEYVLGSFVATAMAEASILFCFFSRVSLVARGLKISAVHGVLMLVLFLHNGL